MLAMRRDLRILSALSLPWAYLAQHSHHGPTGERHKQHEKPAGDEVEEPQSVAEGNGQTKLGSLAVEGVEPRLDLVPLLTGILVVGAESDHVIGGDGGDIEPVAVDVDLRTGGGEHVNSPGETGTGSPAAAQDRLVVAVDVRHVGGAGQDGELGGGLVESGLEPTATVYSNKRTR